MIAKVWSVLMTRGPARGTYAHFFGSIGLAALLGLAYGWVRAST